MYNKQVLSEALANLQKRKARLTQPKDIIVDPMGQYNHPGEITRIPGGDITMANVPYPVMAYPNIGQPQMMYPEQNYNFPGAEYVDEVPIIPKAQRGRNVRYTDNPNDPGIKAYADSLNAYNTGVRLPETWENKDLNYFNENYAGNKGTIKRAVLYPGSTLHYPTQHDSKGDYVSAWENKISGVKPHAIGRSTLYKDGKVVSSSSGIDAIVEYPIYKKPVQPVKYRDPKVVAKQQQLINAGYDIGKADGIWGKKSQAAWDEMNAPVTEKSVETSFKEEQIPTAPREQRPTGLTKQVPKTQWKQLPNGTWYKDTKAGQNATVESTGTDIGGRNLKYGGLVTGAAFQDGGFIDIELTDEEIDEYRRGGYIVEEYNNGGIFGKSYNEKGPFINTDIGYDSRYSGMKAGAYFGKSFRDKDLGQHSVSGGLYGTKDGLGVAGRWDFQNPQGSLFRNKPYYASSQVNTGFDKTRGIYADVDAGLDFRLIDNKKTKATIGPRGGGYLNLPMRSTNLIDNPNFTNVEFKEGVHPLASTYDPGSLTYGLQGKFQKDTDLGRFKVSAGAYIDPIKGKRKEEQAFLDDDKTTTYTTTAGQDVTIPAYTEKLRIAPEFRGSVSWSPNLRTASQRKVARKIAEDKKEQERSKPRIGFKTGGSSLQNESTMPKFQTAGQKRLTPEELMAKDEEDTWGKIFTDHLEQERTEKRINETNKDVINYYNQYMRSPRYREMLGPNPDIDIQRRYNLGDYLDKIPKLTVAKTQPDNSPSTGGYSTTKTGEITVLPQGYGLKGLLPHEWSHSIDRPGKFYQERAIPKKDIDYINKVTLPDSKILEAPRLSKYRGWGWTIDELRQEYPEWLKTETDWKNYVSEPTEVRARLNDIRYQAKKRNLYDPFTQKVTPDIYKKLLNTKFETDDKEGFDALKQLKGIYTDEQILYMLNNISQKENPQNEELNVAQNGGTIQKFQIGNEKKPLPNLFNFTPTPEYVGYQGNVPVSESTRVANTYRPTQQEIKATKEYTQKVGATAEGIRKKTGVSHKEAMQQAEQVLDANFRVQSEAKPYANTKQAQERDAYVFGEGMNADDYFRYPLQFLAGKTPTQKERIQYRIRATDPRTSRLDKFIGTVGEAVNLAPEALLNTGIGLAFAPANLSRLGMVADAVSPIGLPLKKSVKNIPKELSVSRVKPGIDGTPDMSYGAFLNMNNSEKLEFINTVDNTIQNSGLRMLSELTSPEGKKRLIQQFKELNPEYTKEELEQLFINRVNSVRHSITDNRAKWVKVLHAIKEDQGSHVAEEFLQQLNLEDYFPYKNAHYSNQPLFNRDHSHLIKNQGLNQNIDKVDNVITLKKKKHDDFDPTPGYITLGKGYEYSPQTVSHELAHAIQKGEKLPIDDELRNLISSYQLGRGSKVKGFIDDYWRNTFSKSKDLERLQNNLNYFVKGSSGKEPYAFARELRENMLEEGQLADIFEPITKNKLTKFKNTETGITGNNRLLYLVPPWDRKKLAKTLNKAPGLIPYLGAGYLGYEGLNSMEGSNIQEYQQGGIVLDLSDDEIRKYQEAGYVIEEL